MDIALHQGDSFRVSTDMRNNFIDVQCLKYELGFQVNGYTSFHYIEVREKDGMVATFYFKNKGAKKEADMGRWSDAEVVFARNNVHHSRNK